MKQITVSRFCIYSAALISFTAVLGTNTPVLTQTPDNSAKKQTSLTASGMIFPAQGVISQGFRKYKHEGIDIAGASGTPIVAAASGTVIKAGWDDWGLGNAIAIQHPDNTITVYGHTRRLLVTKGQQVTQGQIIAEMGSTGNSTAPHLHFEIHPNGRFAVDPEKVLPFMALTTSASKSQQANRNRAKISPSQSTTVAFGSVNVNTGCSGVTVIQGETANALVKVCQENGQLFYLGQLKQNSTPVKLPALNVGNSRYRADNGSFSYYVSLKGVEVWRNGQKLRSDSFNTSQR